METLEKRNDKNVKSPLKAKLLNMKGKITGKLVKMVGNTPAGKMLKKGLEKQGRRFTSDGYMK